MTSPLRLFWARGREHNAGDWYSPLICEILSGRRVQYAPPHRCDLVAVGSVLRRLNKSHRLHRLGLRRNLDIWGTGALRASDRLHGRHRLHAVRGHHTLAQCLEAADSVEPVFGDPGLLADRLLPSSQPKLHAVGLIPHLVDRGHADIAAFCDRHRHVRVLDLTTSAADLIRQMAQCEIVLSSSLHGLVFADSLSLPNEWFVASDALVGGRHKFDDYYSAFDRIVQPIRLDHFDPQRFLPRDDAPSKSVVEGLKRGLVASFPFA